MPNCRYHTVVLEWPHTSSSMVDSHGRPLTGIPRQRQPSRNVLAKKKLVRWPLVCKKLRSWEGSSWPRPKQRRRPTSTLTDDQSTSLSRTRYMSPQRTRKLNNLATSLTTRWLDLLRSLDRLVTCTRLSFRKL